MIFKSSDPDLQSLVNMLKEGDLNTQPEFQRGEVWGTPKKKRLIDTILRDWQIPPIHVIRIEETGELEVLDGQQRVAAIRDFFAGEFTIDGNIKPHLDEVAKLDGMSFDDLPVNVSRKIKQYALRMFTLESYSPEEPGELFYRLNQPTNLTAAEQRNAYYGDTRNQVKKLVKIFIQNGASKETIGFSNSRMAYDDVIAKYCYTLDVGTISKKATSGIITDLFRSKKTFSSQTFDLAQSAIVLFMEVARSLEGRVKFNKATLYSWLYFVSTLIVNNGNINRHQLAEYILSFEMVRDSSKKNAESRTLFTISDDKNEQAVSAGLISIFNDRSSSRVADVTSVKLRDFVICYLFNKTSNHEKMVKFDDQRMNAIRYFEKYYIDVQHSDLEYSLSEVLNSLEWGGAL